MHHNVYFWLKDPGNAEARDRLISGLKRLRGIEVIRAFTIARPAPTENRDVVDSSFDVSEHMVFDSIEDQKTYQDHPLHCEFVEQCGDLWARVLVYDSLEI